MRLAELALHVAAELRPGAAGGDPGAVDIQSVAPIESAGPRDVTFLVGGEFVRFAATTKAAAVITAKPLADCPAPQLIHKNPYWAFAKTAQLFFKEDHGAVGVSPLAFVAPDAVVGERATIHPFAYVGPRARLGAGVVLYPGVYVGPGAVIGDESVLKANVVVEHGVVIGRRALVHGGTVLGADGFGFAPGEDGMAKIPQVGSVAIGDDVEIGAAVTIDRGALSDTRIGLGSKLDSHVHVGHGTVVGKHCMLCGMSATAGSVVLGDRVILAGHAGVSNRIEIGNDVQVGAMTGVTKDLPEKGTYLGFPAQPAGEWRRNVVMARRLPQLEERMKALEARLAELEGAEKRS
jgi:UDP-3-O-[3-hydroxymyristoyl] glucosamine N-acyltransferase